ncbi:hypothetical protein RHGRI_030390 [Rhododendron griersonianum]|uniref:Uncharacterized protein n=1 Tax=Rhododendron griersonianum TaxID=479676 RepID=A0AAV6IPX6_9ERIC|nr:hypothetical protein RHGRI_030390 [Rhododendron griersonianum]
MMAIKRPGYGSLGKPCELLSNHSLLGVSVRTVYRYEVTFRGFKGPNNAKEFNSILEDLRKRGEFGSQWPVFDGHKYIYTGMRLPFKMKGIVTSEKVGVGRGKVGNAFLTGPSHQTGRGLQLHEAFRQQMCLREIGLTVETCTAMIPILGPTLVSEFVNEYCNAPDRFASLSEVDRLEVERKLQGVKVKITYSQIVETIAGLSDKPIDDLRLGRQTTVVDFCSSEFQLNLNYRRWPGVRVKKKNAWYPMEVITKTDYSTAKRPLELGILVPQDMVAISARILQPPTLYDSTGLQTPTDGSWDMNNREMLIGATIADWICVDFSSLNDNAIKSFCGRLARTCNALGMAFNSDPLYVFSKHPDTVDKTLTELAKYNPTLVLVILPNDHSFHGKVKRLCEVQLGLITQCCRAGRVRLATNYFFDSLAAKINVKVGGQNYKIASMSFGTINDSPFVFEEPTIFFGADVTHYVQKSSLAVVVASMDWPNPSKYRVELAWQTAGVEIISSMEMLIRNQLIAFQKINNCLPKHIIFYRDGVGESQFGVVKSQEVEGIRTACSSLYKEEDIPRLTFLVVQKRHNTRFFAVSPKTKNGNVLPGTVVDTRVCTTAFDFYLFSHLSPMLALTIRNLACLRPEANLWSLLETSPKAFA